MQVRQIQEKDWEACWKVQHESHSSEKRFSADTWLFICKNLTDSFVVVDENDSKIIAHLGFIPVQLKFLDSIKAALWHVSLYTLENFRGRDTDRKKTSSSH